MKKLLIIILLSCLQSVIAGDFDSAFGQQPTLNSKESMVINEASDCENDKEALDILLQASKNNWAGSAIWYNLANVQMRTNLTKDAISSYQKALELLPAFFIAQRNLAFSLSKIGEDEKAFEQMRKTLALSGGSDLQTLLWLTSYYSRKSDYSSALNFCNQALLYNPENKQLVLAKSIYLLELNFLEECETYCVSLLEDDKNNIDILRVLGKSRAKNQSYISAISIFEQIEKSQKANVGDTKFLADLLFKEGFYCESAKYYSKIKALDSLEKPVMAMIYTGDFKSAKAFVNHLKSPIKEKVLGLVDLAENENSSDLKYLKEYINLVPDDSYILSKLADFYYKNENYSQARTLYMRLFNDVTYSKSSLYSLMNICIKKHDYLQALNFAKKISKDYPSKEISEYAKKLQQYCSQLD